MLLRVHVDVELPLARRARRSRATILRGGGDIHARAASCGSTSPRPLAARGGHDRLPAHPRRGLARRPSTARSSPATLTGLDSPPHGAGGELLTIVLVLAGVAIFAYVAPPLVEAIAGGRDQRCIRGKRGGGGRSSGSRPLHHLRLRPRRPPRRPRSSARPAIRTSSSTSAPTRSTLRASAATCYVEGSGTEDEDLATRGARPGTRARRVVRLRRGQPLHHALGALAAARPDDRRARERRGRREEAQARRRRPRRPRRTRPPASRWRSSSLKPQVAAFLDIVSTAQGDDFRSRRSR